MYGNLFISLLRSLVRLLHAPVKHSMMFELSVLFIVLLLLQQFRTLLPFLSTDFNSTRRHAKASGAIRQILWVGWLLGKVPQLIGARLTS